MLDLVDIIFRIDVTLLLMCFRDSSAKEYQEAENHCLLIFMIDGGSSPRVT